MALLNENYLKLPGSYLFSDIAKKITQFKEKNPAADVIRLGIGDVTQPLVPAVIKGLHEAVEEMANATTFRGYGPEQGYDFLIRKVLEYDYAARWACSWPRTRSSSVTAPRAISATSRKFLV